MSLVRLFRMVNGLLLALVLVALWRFGSHELVAFERVREGAQALNHLQQALLVGETLSGELAPSLQVMTQGVAHTHEAMAQLQRARQRSDEALAFLDEIQRSEADPARAVLAANAVSRTRLVIEEVRRSVNAAAGLPEGVRSDEALASLARLREAVDQMLPLIDAYAFQALAAFPESYAAIQGAQLVAAISDSASALETSLRSAITAGRPFVVRERAEIDRSRGRINLLSELLERQLEPLDHLPGVAEAAQAVRQGPFHRTRQLVQEMVDAGSTSPAFYPMGPQQFVQSFEADLMALPALREVLIEDAVRHAEQRTDAAWGEMVLTGAVLLVMALGLGGIMWLLHHRVFRPLSLAAEAINQMASGRHELVVPQVTTHDEIGAVMGALHNLKDGQSQAARLADERDALINRLRALSTTDPLTGLMNRRAFFELAERELANAQRHGFDLTVVLLDIDHFKTVNDTHGHAVGDRALVAVAATLRNALRQGDLVARFGGEEFVLMLVHCARGPGMGFAERVRHCVAGVSLSDEHGNQISLTASLGVASSSDLPMNLDLLLAQADAAMYRAKRSGRNQVACLQGGDPLISSPTLAAASAAAPDPAVPAAQPAD